MSSKSVEDLLDWAANFSLIAALRPADEIVPPEYALELEASTLEADDEGMTEAID